MTTLAKKRLAMGLVLAGVFIAGCVVLAVLNWPPPHYSYAAKDGTELKFRTEGDKLLAYDGESSWEELFVKGVNLGATVPGYFPGEFPITEDDYLRWFQQIDDMGANVIRIYTVHNPVFYKSLVKYNRDKGKDPLYFIQGIWSPEEQLIEQQDAYIPGIKEAFHREIEKAVKAVYGDLKVPKQPGTSGGKYTANAGPYLMAWHIGTEWDPEMVDNTNRKHAELPPYQGQHFTATDEASPFESWLAELVDDTAQKERAYGWEHPITFTNWVTTDVLQHPGEPLFEEDLASVDATHIRPVEWEAGYFAAYHAYPYYPDFFHLDKTLETIPDGDGDFNTYKAYLQELKNYYKDIPVMITEYGVPSSLGVSHLGRGGRNQGGHNEQEQGEINVSLTKDIYDTGYAGAILFMWQDEWFKKTWNTMRFEIPEDRRAFWLNVLTNEKQFGLLSMGPGKEDDLMIDGKLEDWESLPEGEVHAWDRPSAGIDRLQVTHDEAYVYVGLQLSDPFDPAKRLIRLGADTQPGGNQPVAELPGRTLSDGLEAIVEIGNDEETEVLTAPSYDFHRRLYGRYGYWMLDDPTEEQTVEFQPWKLAVSLTMTPPDTRFAHPFRDMTVGKLIRGTTDPGNADFNSLASWQYSGNEVELRIPWMLLGFADPSSRQVIDYRPLKEDRAFSTTESDGLTLIPWIMERGEAGVLGPGTESGETRENVSLDAFPKYVWQPWETVQYTERLKSGYYALQAFYQSLPDRRTTGE
ncbi:hypothetical protein J53TS2_16070 [Paenibacillus sp. J53TS2]|uniref:hypothetical protein n=1 Tax=Paenibacillus sp. J53TS2 TaxID=2807197 RepID=UPI001B19417A|nr:hypothetical protein [Paenibacillus sp. J53TS2]GIP48016.1 hypothetical protein J53TS2_16070 [Paenibacillus sp. J53TS2]